MNSHSRALLGQLLTAMLLVTILATAGSVAAHEPIGVDQAPGQADSPPAVLSRAGADAVARPDPLQSSAVVGQTIVVNMYLQDVVGLYAADIQLSFDPEILQVQDANPDAPGVQIQPLTSFFVPGFIIKQKACNAPDLGDPDCQAGGLAWYAAAQLNPSPPATGSGALAAITFKAVKAGDSQLVISYVQLSDSNGVPISSTHLDGTVHVSDLTISHYLYLPVICR
jgi:hypothetical protein